MDKPTDKPKRVMHGLIVLMILAGVLLFDLYRNTDLLYVAFFLMVGGAFLAARTLSR